jgi:hypothetical protein
MRNFPHQLAGMEKEIRVFNRDVILDKPQLTDIWKQANPEASFSPEVKRILNMRK